MLPDRCRLVLYAKTQHKIHGETRCRACKSGLVLPCYHSVSFVSYRLGVAPCCDSSDILAMLLDQAWSTCSREPFRHSPLQQKDSLGDDVQALLCNTTRGKAKVLHYLEAMRQATSSIQTSNLPVPMLPVLVWKDLDRNSPPAALKLLRIAAAEQPWQSECQT